MAAKNSRGSKDIGKELPFGEALFSFQKGVDKVVVIVYNNFVVILSIVADCGMSLAGRVVFCFLDKIVVNVYNSLVINLSDLGNAKADRC